MIQRVLDWKQHLRIVIGGRERVFVIADGAHFLLRGSAYVEAAELLDGQRSVAEILTAAGNRAPEVLFALRALEERGYIAEADPPNDATRFWQALGSEAHVVGDRLAATPVALDGDDRGVMREALLDAGVRIADDAARRIVVDGYPLVPGKPYPAGIFLPVRLAGLTPWIGPWLGTDGGPCARCLAQRLAWNHPVESWLSAHGHPITAPYPSLPATERAAANLAALAIASWIADGGTGAIDDHLVAFSLTDLRATNHRVVRRPQCKGCGDEQLLTAQAWRPIELASRPRAARTDGGYRTVAPEDTVARLEHHVSAITGVIASLGPVAGRDHPLRPVFGAVYRVTPTGVDPDFDDFHRMSSGKGATRIQAKASALCEAIERISAIWHGDEVIKRRTLATLDGVAVDPDALQNFSAAQLAARDPDEHGKHRVPHPYHPDLTLEWTPAWSLTHDRQVYLPTDYCYLHTDTDDASQVCVFNPNGHAAGNCLEEAILQGFLELVERDAVAIWWYARLRVPAVDLDGFDEPYFGTLRDHYRDLGYEVRVLDVTTDLDIPTFVAIADGARPAIGFGCHLDARLGVQRALTELNQIFTTDPDAPPPWDPSRLADAEFLHADPRLALRTARDYPAAPAGDLRDDVLACVARAAALGLDTIVLDQTRPDLGLSAVKVVVPGLRHFWPRLGPGRLYDVPAARGVVVTEDTLNPVPLLL